jgi:hypothetical protein
VSAFNHLDPQEHALVVRQRQEISVSADRLRFVSEFKKRLQHKHFSGACFCLFDQLLISFVQLSGC